MRRSCILLFFALIEPVLAQRVITRIAGADWLFPADGQPAINAPLSGSLGLDIAVDKKGNYYLADPGNLMVMRVGSDGLINVVAGNGVSGFNTLAFVSGDGGLAVNAAIFQPTAVAVDSAGNVYIAEYGSRVRKVATDGTITTFAGTGNDGFTGDGGLATKAQVFAPFGLAVDSSGNVFIADTYNNRIRKVANGVITTVAGNGQPGSTGDGGKAAAAEIYQPTRLAVDTAGNVFFVETANPANVPRIRMVDIKGNISTVAGGGFDFSDGIPALKAGIIPLAVAVDAAGNLYLVDGLADGVRKVDTQGIITTIAGGSSKVGFAGDGGPATNAVFAFNGHPSVAVDAAGNLYVDDEGNNRIRRITPDGIIDTVAGNGQFRLAGNGGPASLATLDYPISVTGDQSGNLYISEQTQNRIRRIARDGTISVYAGNGTEGFSGDGGPATSASLSFPGYLAIAPAVGYLVFSDTFNCRVRYVDNNGNVQTYAGGGGCQDSGDSGPATSAGISSPGGIDFDPAGDLFISEPLGNRIRVVFPPSDGRIGTLTGDGNPGYSGDNGPSTKAEVNGPVGVRFHNGFLYFCDSRNNVIRRIDTTVNALTITTIAGNGQPGYSGDGGPATQASLSNPQSISFDADGNMYIADEANRVIRIVTPDGTINTFAGAIKAKGENDGGLAINAGLGAITDLFVDPAGDILLTDVFFNRVRAVLVNPPTFQASPGSLAFTAPAGSTPVSQSIGVTGSISGIPFTAAAASSGWLEVSPASGFMPTSIQITADPSKLDAGPNSGSITITAAAARPSTQKIQVALTATAAGAPSLSVKPAALTFSFVEGSSAGSKPISVSNAGGGSLNFKVTAATVSGGAWLSASPGGASLNAFGSTTILVAANSAKLPAGTYAGTLTLESVNPPESVIVPVTMTVTAVPQTILIPQTGLTFFAVQGGGLPLPQFFNILNSGVGLMPSSIMATTLSGGPWLSVFPSSGTSDANSDSVPQIRLDANPKGLAAGVYYGTVQVSSATANNSPQFVSVILNVLAPGSKIGPQVQPTGLIFTGIAGGESPGSQTVTVQSTESNPVTFHSGRVTADGGAWLTSVPSDASVTPEQQVRIVVQPQTAGLAAGVYHGTLTLSFSDGNRRVVAIVLVLVPPGSVLANTEMHAEATTGCHAKLLAPVFTQLSSGFSIPAGFPGQVTVKVVDDCANPTTSGDVTVSFSNGDPPLQLVSLKDGNWAGTWTPVFSAAQVTVTADAQTPNGLKGEVSITGGLQANTQPPVVGAGAVVNGASYAAAAPLAPGSLITIFGSKLAESKAYATGLPLPTDLGGSSIVLAGRQAPLLFASDGQVNAMLPYGTAVNTQQQLIVLRGNSVSVPQAVTVAPVAPGIFTVDGSGKGQGTIFIGNGRTMADSGHPAHAGDVVVIYCTGLGEVTPAVPSGTPAPSAPPAKTVNAVNVNIGGLAAPVQFAGLTPGLVGVYQVNAVVPAIPAGDHIPVTITAAGQQSARVTIGVR